MAELREGPGGEGNIILWWYPRSAVGGGKGV